MLNVMVTQQVNGGHRRNKHPMGCEAQLAWKCLFTFPFFGGKFWPVYRSNWSSFSSVTRVH